jgi:hypothetical protein
MSIASKLREAERRKQEEAARKEARIREAIRTSPVRARLTGVVEQIIATTQP